MLVRRTLEAVLPGAALAGAWLAALLVPDLGGRLVALAPAIAGGAALAGACMAGAFRRGRLLVALAAVCVAAWAHGGAALSGGDAYLAYVCGAVALLLPANLAASAWLPERPVLSAATVWRLLVVLVQAGVTALAWSTDWEPVIEFAGSFGAAAGEPGGWTPLTRLGTATFAAGISIVLVRVVRAPSPSEAGLAWAMAAAFAGLQARESAPAWFALAIAELTLATLLAAAGLAYRDALTGLPSRRAFDDALARPPERFAVAVVDVDHFKRINDTYGHDVGDQVLRMVATRLVESGGSARAYRTGGEEFALLFPGLTAAQAMERAEAVRRSFADRGFALRAADRPRRRPRRPAAHPAAARTLKVTVSIGVAARSGRDEPAAKTVGDADAALLFAKRAGRNRVVEFA